MNGLAKPFGKKPHPKKRKNNNNQSEIAACEQRSTSEEASFCSNTIFSLYLKLDEKVFRRKTSRFFAPLLVLA